MSSIIEKAFDASKKIFRSVFLGSPNLITTSDLNRQLEAIKYQMDQLDDKVGILSDFSINYSLTGGTIDVTYLYTYMEYKGCSFSPEKLPLTINLTNSAPICYICITANKEVITYANDFSHEIAGAKFADGTSYPAADQLVYREESILITHSLTGVQNLVGVLAVIELTSYGNIIVRNNCLRRNSTVIMDSSKIIQDFIPTAKGAVKNNISYEMGFSILENRFNNLSPIWKKLTTIDYTSSSSGVEIDTETDFKIANGILYINKFSESISKVTTKGSLKTISLGNFPSSIKGSIVNYFKSLDLRHYDNLNTDSQNLFIPFGEFGTFSVYSPYKPAGVPLTYPEKFPIFGRAKVSLILVYDVEKVLVDVFIGTYIDSIVKTASSYENWEFKDGPVDWSNLQNPTGTIYIPRFFGSMPLFGPY